MVTWPDDSEDKIAELMDDKNKEVDMVIFKLSGKSEFVLEESGKGGRSRVEEILSSNMGEVMTGAFMVCAVDDREVTVSVRRKYIHFIFVGKDTGVMTKGRVNSQSGEMKNKFPFSHMFLQLNGDIDDLNEDALEKTLRACGGAHQPTSFDFTNEAIES